MNHEKVKSVCDKKHSRILQSHRSKTARWKVFATDQGCRKIRSQCDCKRKESSGSKKICKNGQDKEKINEGKFIDTVINSYGFILSIYILNKVLNQVMFDYTIQRGRYFEAFCTRPIYFFFGDWK